MPAGATGVVATVIDADTIRLKGGKADVRLVGIQAPKLPLGRKGFAAWPLAGEARAALVDLLKDRNVSFRLGATARVTRYGAALDPGTSAALDFELGSAPEAPQ